MVPGVTGKFFLGHSVVGGFRCDELVLYDLRLLAKQFLGTILDIEVDHTAW